ncbi:inorganic triphosphatase [Pseudidiomarina insulisalsae]|uniref:Phosphate-binding protein n=1 Tax=Pseudidiomarina insulisalsae TaxID=575789 RepID=A0A432YHS3_9GAMM|nr:CYTH and CHAD domain-containing protein [Pseudidiomarina insulisalsae]RUO60506.1 phosphate-binding protein [Pseudidiomarina insulisalsae]
MSQEIELKLLVDANAREKIMQLCQSLAKGAEHDTLHLRNSYFDTADLRLRQHDMGLRIRQHDDEREQTIKLAGEVLGGMHTRPEYNAVVTSDTPDLTLFEEDIWPDDFPLFDINRELEEIFATDFTRHRWHIPSAEGRIELVYDEGVIRAGEHERAIAEIEIEVQQGDIADAYKMARRLITRVNARLGSLSKAARGYLLAGKTVLEPFTHAHFVPQEPNDGVGIGLYRALTYALQYWQHNDACLAEMPSVRAVAGITDGIRLSKVVLQQLAALEVDVSDHILRLEQMLGHLGWLSRYDGLTELTAEDGAYHRALKQHPKLYEAILEQQEHAVQLELVQSLSIRDDYQLTLLELGALCHQQPRHEEIAELPLKQWAAQRLREDWQGVIDAFAKEGELKPEYYLKQLPLLQSSLQLGYCVGYLFDEEDREQFRAPWQDMMRGIREIMALKLLREAIKDNEDSQPDRLLNWQQVQLESLLYALEHSRKAALKQEPYWLS